MSEKLALILSEEDFRRIRIRDGKTPRIDLHYLTRQQALKLIKKVVALLPTGITMQIIHGYHHGDAILKMLRDEKLSRRKYTVFFDKDNQGASYIRVN